MSKKIITAKCMTSNSNINGSSATFAVNPLPEEKKPGEANTNIETKTVVQVNFSTSKEAREFETGKDYKITIEG